jgi:hypothetical protein
VINQIQEQIKYQLIKPIIKTRFGGLKTLKEQLVLAGMVENFELIENFVSFIDVIIHMCLNAKLFGVLVEPELYHLRVVTSLRNVNKQFIDSNEIKVVACAKSKKYDPKKLTYEIDELSFDNYLQGKPIANICYLPKEDNWLKTMIDNLLIDNEEFEELQPIFNHNNKTISEIFYSLINQVLDPGIDINVNTSTLITSPYSLHNSSQTSCKTTNDIAMQNSNNLNQYLMEVPYYNPNTN